MQHAAAQHTIADERGPKIKYSETTDVYLPPQRPPSPPSPNTHLHFKDNHL